MTRSARFPFALAALALSAGCVFPVARTVETGLRIAPGDARRVVTGRTTKAELFERLGPPMAIAGPRERVEVPAANVVHVDSVSHGTVKFGGGRWTQQGDAWLELFAARRPLRDAHRVYYWYATTEGGFKFFLLVGGAIRSERTQELWVLVDEETGLAEGAYFRGR